ncbi:hypothetical protein OAP25_02065 [Flavobacteriaceae bacterium]|nr:hypothetical protein [Flavobacteriaceae bacterium]
MTTTLNSFISETQLATAEATIVSTTSSEKKFIGMATVTNTATTNKEVTVWRISATGTGSTGIGGNWIWRKTIAAGTTEHIDKIMGHVLGNSMKISALTDTASVINIDISGTTET